MGEVEGYLALAFGLAMVILTVSVQGVKARARADKKRLEERLAYAEQYIVWLDGHLWGQKQQLEALEARGVASPAPVAEPPPQALVPELGASPPSEPERVAEPSLASEVSAPGEAEPSPSDGALSGEAPGAPELPAPPWPVGAEASPASERPRAGFDWENLIGVRLFAWLGGGTLFLGAALFLHYSIQQNLISPSVRVANGLVIGAVAVAGGDRLRQRTRMAAEAISGAGVGILYASLFAAHSLYHLIDSTPSFIGMGLVTVTAGLIAIRRDAFLVAVLGLIGGMSTPWLLSTGEDRPVAFFVYVLLLDSCILVVAKKRSWPVLALLGFVGSIVICIGWAMRYLQPGRTAYALGGAAVLAGLFSLVKLDSAAKEGTKAAAVPRLVGVAGVFTPFVAAFVLSDHSTLTVDPLLLAGYLVLVSGVAWLAGQRASLPPLAPFTAAFSVLSLTARPDHSLFPAGRDTTLASFAIVPIAYVVGWYLRRSKPDGRALATAAAIVLGGSWLVVLRVLGMQPHDDPRFSIWAYAAVNAGGLLLLGAVTGYAIFVALAQALSLGALFLVTRGIFEPRVTELAATCVSGLAFYALPLITPLFRRDRWAWLASACSLPLHFLLLYGVAHQSWGATSLGAIAVACAALSLFSFDRARREATTLAEHALSVRAALGGEVLLFLTAAIPILLDKEWLTLSWGLEVAALAWLKRRVPHRGLVWVSALLAAAVSARLLVNSGIWHYHPRSDLPILNFYLYAFGIPVVAFLVAAWLFEGDPDAAWLLRGDTDPLRVRLTSVLRVVATLLLFFLLNIEIADYYSKGHTIAFQLSSGGLAQDMTYSLAWLIFGLGLMALGLARHVKAPRIGAIFVILVTLAKVFLHDLWALGALYRVGSMIGLAVALLLVSFLGQRFILSKDAP